MAAPLPSLDAFSRRKLVLAKQLYRHALVQADVASAPARIIVVLAFDLSIETMLKTVAALDGYRKLDRTFDDLKRKADAVLQNHGQALPRGTEITHLHGIRNAAQHESRQPTEAEVQECTNYADSFLREITQQVWGTSFEAIGLAGLVQTSHARRFLERAEQRAQQGNWHEAALDAGAALEVILSGLERRFRESDHGGTRLDRDQRRRERTMIEMMHGVSGDKYERFRRSVGVVSLPIGSLEAHHQLSSRYPVQQLESEFALAFATDAILSIEARVGPLERVDVPPA